MHAHGRWSLQCQDLRCLSLNHYTKHNNAVCCWYYTMCCLQARPHGWPCGVCMGLRTQKSGPSVVALCCCAGCACHPCPIPSRDMSVWLWLSTAVLVSFEDLARCLTKAVKCPQIVLPGPASALSWASSALCPTGCSGRRPQACAVFGTEESEPVLVHPSEGFGLAPFLKS